MKFKIFAIRDNKAKVYGTPFFLAEEGQAIRQFTDLANNKDSLVGRHPQDFTLFRIGAYADNTAVLIGSDPIFSLGNALEFVHEEIIIPDDIVAAKLAMEKTA